MNLMECVSYRICSNVIYSFQFFCTFVMFIMALSQSLKHFAIEKTSFLQKKMRKVEFSGWNKSLCSRCFHTFIALLDIWCEGSSLLPTTTTKTHASCLQHLEHFSLTNCQSCNSSVCCSHSSMWRAKFCLQWMWNKYVAAMKHISFVDKIFHKFNI